MDILNPVQRKKCMQSNKSKGTKPELLLAKSMWKLGLRYRKNVSNILGKPDFCFKKYKIAIFVDGEFWHGKDWKEKKSKITSNRDFWIKKIEKNMQRDAETSQALRNNGWLVFRFWGKDIEKHASEIAEKIYNAIKNQCGI